MNQTPESDDILTIHKTSTTVVIYRDSVPYQLTLWGFVPSADGTCPATVPSTAQRVSTFTTKEGLVSYACVYGTFEQERYVTIAKTATAGASSQDVTIPSFSFSADARAGAESMASGTPVTTVVSGLKPDSEVTGFVSDTSFGNTVTATALGSSGTDFYDGADGSRTTRKIQYQAFLVGKSDFTISETTPSPSSGDGSQSGWALTDVTCLNGEGDTVNVTRTANGVSFENVGIAPSARAVPITCTFTNSYTAKSTITLVKKLGNAPAGVTASQWDLTASALSPDTATSGTVVSGSSGTTSVTSRVVPSGPYHLSEVVNRAGVAGFVRTGLSCVNTTTGAALTVSSSDDVTLPDGAKVTCTYTNTYRTGSLSVSKTLLDQHGHKVNLASTTDGYVGDGSFTLGWTCTGNGVTRSGSVAVTANGSTVTVASDLPVGLTYTVSEDSDQLKQSDLAGSAYSWLSPQSSAAVTIAAGTPQTLSITNRIHRDLPPAGVDKSYQTTTQHLVRGVWDGTWDVSYTITVTNPSSAGAIHYSLTDTPTTPTGSTLHGVTVVHDDKDIDLGGQTITSGTALTIVPGLPEGTSRGADGNLVKADGTPVTDTEGNPVADPRATVQASGSDVYTVVLNVSARADGAAVAAADAASCAAIVPGSEVSTIHNSTTVTSNGATSTDSDCGSIPRSPTFSVTKTNAGGARTATRNDDGSDTATYEVTVTNRSTTSSTLLADLTDRPTLPAGATLRGATVSIGGAVTTLGTSPEWTLARAGTGALAGGTSRTYVVAVTFTVNASATGYDAADYACAGTAGQGYTAGIVNSVSMDGDTTQGDNTACQSLTASLNVTKTIADGDNGGVSGAASFDVTYTITATNSGALPISTGAITDTPGFATGLTIHTVWSSQDESALGTGATTVTAVDGAYPVTHGVVVEPGASQVFYLRFHVTLTATASGDNASQLACSAGEDGTPTSAHGLFNAVTAAHEDPQASRTDNAACGPVGPRTITISKTGTQPTGDANTDGSYPLAGASFAIYDADPTAADFDGRDPVQTLADPDGTLTSFTTQTLELGRTYWLVETKAPAGHNLLAAPVAFTLGTDAEDLTTISVASGQNLGSSTITTVNATGGHSPVAASLTVRDNTTGSLPVSGGNGIGVNVIWALLLLAGAAGLGLTTTASHRTTRIRP